MDAATEVLAEPVSPLSGSEVWQPLPARAAPLFMLANGFFFVIPAIPLGILGSALMDEQAWPAWLPGLGLALLLVALGAWSGRLRWRQTQWKLDADGLHVRRGLWWRTEVLVPRSRVQHLDLERGPLERRRLLATLVVHTAGTRHHALRQAGLDDAIAVALRDALVPEANRHGDAL